MTTFLKQKLKQNMNTNKKNQITIITTDYAICFFVLIEIWQIRIMGLI